jgi:hypothetical protein
MRPRWRAAIGFVTQESYAELYQEQFEGGNVQWRCPDGDVLADRTVRQRVAQSA